MTEPQDVLLIESHRGAGNNAARALEAAGHRVERCHPAGNRGFPCAGVAEPDGCPIDRGVDVALLVRPRVSPRPTALEGGVSCAIRAGVPIVEYGPAILDPFESWVTARTAGDVAEACVDTVTQSFQPLRHDVVARITPLLHAAGIKPGSVGCQVKRDFPQLHIRLRGPSVDKRIEQALAVRVLDAVRASGRTYGAVDVSYEITRSEA